MNDSSDTPIGSLHAGTERVGVDYPWALREGVAAWPPRSEDQLRELWVSFALRHTSGLGPRTWRRLAKRYKDPMGAVLAARRWAADGVVSDKVAREFTAENWRIAARKEWDAVRDRGLAVVLWSDPDYPQRLKEIPGPPIYLYRIGNPGLLRGPCVAVVGSRQVSDWGRSTAYTLGCDLSQAGITVVSGMARGVDRHAHIGAMEGIGASIAVLGTGPDRIYPASNRDIFQTLARGGLVITEFSPGVEPVAGHFPVRNRIISGLSLGVVVVEAREKSGALITARQALEQGRDVFAVSPPENAAGFEGCARLIEEGALPIQSASDILAELGPLLVGDAVITATEDPPREPAGEGLSHEPRGKRQDLARDSFKPQGVQSGAKTPVPRGNEPGLETEEEGGASTESHAPVGGEGGVLLEAMDAGATVHVDELAERLGWDVSRVSRVLLVLELEGLVHQWPGMRYSRHG